MAKNQHNLKGITKAIFLDRDGVINEYVGEVTKEKDFIIYAFAAEAIQKINDAGYLAIVITNQPGVAKGFMTEQTLQRIHQKMESEIVLGEGKIDAVYYCPHHPEKGFEGEILALKIDCVCRKPKIGMITKAVKDFNIDLEKSFFIGDSITDAKTAENAGIKFIGVKTGFGVKDGKHQLRKKFPLYENLLDAVMRVLKK